MCIVSNGNNKDEDDDVNTFNWACTKLVQNGHHLPDAKYLLKYVLGLILLSGMHLFDIFIYIYLVN